MTHSTTDSDNVQPALLEQLQRIWTALLDVDVVDRSDNFVALGGDSISATLCVNRIRAAFGVHVPVTTLLDEDATFGTFASEVQRQTAVIG